MSQAMLEAARGLIQDKKYREAQAILRDVDDPIAVKWLGQIADLQRAEMVRKKPKAASWRMVGMLAATLSILLIAIAVKYISDQPPTVVSSPTGATATITPIPTATLDTIATLIAQDESLTPASNSGLFGGTLCGDGTYSSSTGRGTCSHHSGEAGRTRTRSKK